MTEEEVFESLGSVCVEALKEQAYGDGFSAGLEQGRLLGIEEGKKLGVSDLVERLKNIGPFTQVAILNQVARDMLGTE